MVSVLLQWTALFPARSQFLRILALNCQPGDLLEYTEAE